MKNINGLSNNMIKKINKANENLPAALVKLEELYSDFIKQMEKSDFKNSPRRYIVELGYVKNLKKSSESFKLSSEIEKWTNKEKELCLKLDEFGIKIND